nr:MAG TPA: hypothetical protein [Caudoviricetes sp.]
MLCIWWVPGNFLIVLKFYCLMSLLTDLILAVK